MIPNRQQSCGLNASAYSKITVVKKFAIAWLK